MLSPRIISPRSNDLQGLRLKFKEQYDSLQRKDDEIEELHKIIFELRPKLEKEVESQVTPLLPLRTCVAMSKATIQLEGLSHLDG